MKKYLANILIGFTISVVAISCQQEDVEEVMPDESEESFINSSNGALIPDEYIIVFNDEASAFSKEEEASYEARVFELRTFANSMIRAKSIENFEIDKVFVQVFKGISIKVSANLVDEIAQDSRVKFVEQNKIIARPPWDNPNDVPSSQEQEVPYGIERVGYGDGTGKVAWIIDTGIDLDHEDLNVDETRGFSAFSRGIDQGFNDLNGHGTHCAGTVAAIDNGIGVVGVAAGATVIPIKVLGWNGSGSTSGVIAGVDYVAANASAGDAVNMSLGGGISNALDEAILNAAKKQIYIVLAAGNESDNANNYSPARVNGDNIWTISAMDSNDEFANFSNYGNAPVDFCEPGVAIKSTFFTGGYATLSGTSMAAPHFCGIILMTNGNPRTDGFVNGDPDGNADPIGAL